MRKIIAIVFYAFALISCERYIEINPAGPKRELVLNALIASSDTTHYISVSVSRKDAIEYPRVVTLKSYVNDIPSDEVSVGDTLRVTRRLLSTDNSLDPMLHKEVAIGNNTLISNTFNLFTDEGFPDGACDITLLIKNPFTGEQQEKRDGGSTIAVPHYDLYLRVFNISTETFRYYSCLSDQYTLIGDTYLVDYPSFPSNVDGGLGYVSAGGADEVFLGSKAARMVLPWM